jgi:hypothetical protein
LDRLQKRARRKLLKDAPPSSAPVAQEIPTPLDRLQREASELYMAQRPACDHAVLRSFALQYNECSVLAVAKWVNFSDAPHAETAMKHVITSPTIFHKCTVCGEFGHYEILCAQVAREDSLFLRNEIEEALARGKPITETAELCEGFVVEQSLKPFSPKRRKRGRKRSLVDIEVTELDRLKFKAAPGAETLL